MGLLQLRKGFPLLSKTLAVRVRKENTLSKGDPEHHL